MASFYNVYDFKGVWVGSVNYECEAESMAHRFNGYYEECGNYCL